MHTITIDPEQIHTLLSRHLDSAAVRDRRGSLDGEFDDLVARCLELREPERALAVWAVQQLALVGHAADAASQLASRLMVLAGDPAAPHELLAAVMHEGREVRACRVCGCTDARACPGGCRWVENDLCSCCATWPFPGCSHCNAPAPVTIEAGIRSGWSPSGVCTRCQRGARRR